MSGTVLDARAAAVIENQVSVRTDPCCLKAFTVSWISFSPVHHEWY